jgi:ABC-type transport system substrate-binding protein
LKVGRLCIAAALILAVSLVGSNFGGDTTVSTKSARPNQTPVKGGTIILGAQRWPQCLNPITRCAERDWVLSQSVNQYVMPRATQLTVDGTFTKSPLTIEYPSLANGDLIPSPFTVRYKINSAATWADGTAITCNDFEFTRNAIMNTRGAVARDNYKQIASIDCTDPKTAVLRFTSLYTDWADLFGGATGVVLEKAAFPKEEHEPKVDLSKEMRSDIPFSGGPWILEFWNQEQTDLVPNVNYWGHKPNFDHVTIRAPIEDSTTQAADLLNGTVNAIFPMASGVSLVNLFGTNRSIGFKSGPGQLYEALWLNVGKFPFGSDPSRGYSSGDAESVRQAFFWAVDRDAVLKAVVNGNDPTQRTPLGCGLLAVPGSFWCDQQPFARFHYDTRMVDHIMTAGGFAKDPAGFWAKNGQEVSFEYATTFQNERRITQSVLRVGMIAAGFNVRTAAYDPVQLAGTRMPHGDFQAVDIAEAVESDPSVTELLGCPPPGPESGYGGANAYVLWCDLRATTLMHASDTELDPERRRALLDQVYQLEAQSFAAGLPLYVVPNVTAWRADRIAGPVGEWNGTLYGGFFNIDEWYCVRPGACG